MPEVSNETLKRIAKLADEIYWAVDYEDGVLVTQKASEIEELVLPFVKEPKWEIYCMATQFNDDYATGATYYVTSYDTYHAAVNHARSEEVKKLEDGQQLWTYFVRQVPDA